MPIWPFRRDADKPRSGCATVMTAVSMLSMVLGIWMAVRWRSQPDYWTRNAEFLSQRDPAQIADLARNAESRMMNSVSAARPGAEQIVELPLGEINAWLATRLGEWLANQQIELPREVSNFMVSCEDSRIVLAFEFDSPAAKQIVSLVMTPAMMNNGDLMLRLDEIRAGNLPVKASWIEDHLPKATNRDDAVNVADLIKGKRFTPVFPHPVDRRLRLRVLDFRLQPGSVWLKVRGESSGR